MRKFIKSFAKPVLVAVLVVTMALSVVPVFSFAAFAETEGIFNYEVQDGKATITGFEDETYCGEINIPSVIGGYPVTSIGDCAFEECTGLTSITIPDGVTFIGGSAFAFCTALTSITIPDSVTAFGATDYDAEAFYGCIGLKTAGPIGGGYDYEFGWKDRIPSYAFRGCTELRSITIPDGVSDIGSFALSGGTELRSITIPDRVTSIGVGAFSGCVGLTSITIPGNMTEIGYGAFSYVRSLTSITIPNSVISIGESAFEECTGLKSITIPNSVTSIGSRAFYNCSGLTDATIGNSVTSIGGFVGCTNLKNITIPNSVTSIDMYAFSGCAGLKSVKIPNSVTSIEEGAFSDCTGLTSITIPYSVKYIGPQVFSGCKNLKTVYYMGTKGEFAAIGARNNWSKINVVYHNHSYKTTSSKATLAKNGKTVKKCSKCGKTVTTVYYYPKTVSISKSSYDYSGKTITPEITVKNSKGKALKKGTDYTVSYSSGRKKVGNYSVTVKFKGNYTGKKTLKFKIVPKISFSSASIFVKQTKKINAKSSNKITYKSSNKKVVSVNSKGVITGLKNGSATITVTSNKISRTIKVNVNTPYVKLDKSSLSILEGKSASLTATVLPKNAKVTWSSANTNIAKVSSKGKVTGVYEGTTTIKAYIKYNGKTYQKTCKVTVKRPTAKLKLPATPISVSYYSDSAIKITAISYKIVNEGSYDEIHFYITGEKVYDKRGNNYSACSYVGYKLYDGKGYVVDTGDIRTPALKVGDKFKNCEVEITFWDGLPIDTYRLEILDIG